MSFLESAIVLPIWQIIMVILIFGGLILMLGFGLLRVLVIPECRILLGADLRGRYVLFNHSSYSTAVLSSVKIGEIALEPTKNGTKIRPRHKDDVERTGRINWIHSHDLSLYPASSTTAFIVDRFIAQLKQSGLPESNTVIDALLRCKLDEKNMIGYVDEIIMETIISKKEDGEIIYEMFKDPDGSEYKRPVMERKETPVKYQTQITASEMEILKDLKEKMESWWFGIDSSGANIFSYAHLSEVVDVGVAGTPADVEDLQHVAERRGMMKSKKDAQNYMLYAIVAVILAIAAGVFLKLAGVV